MPQVNLPHWLSVSAATAGAACAALAVSTSPLLTPYDSVFAIGAAVCGFLASFNLSKKA